MSKVSVYNMKGAVVGDVELNDAVFGVEINEHLVHQAVVAQLANKRQGTQSAKTRSEVSGGGRRDRKAPDMPARVPSVPHSGKAAGSSSPRSRVIMRSA